MAEERGTVYSYLNVFGYTTVLYRLFCKGDCRIIYGGKGWEVNSFSAIKQANKDCIYLLLLLLFFFTLDFICLLKNVYNSFIHIFPFFFFLFILII